MWVNVVADSEGDEGKEGDDLWCSKKDGIGMNVANDERGQTTWRGVIARGAESEWERSGAGEGEVGVKERERVGKGRDKM